MVIAMLAYSLLFLFLPSSTRVEGPDASTAEGLSAATVSRLFLPFPFQGSWHGRQP